MCLKAVIRCIPEIFFFTRDLFRRMKNERITILSASLGFFVVFALGPIVMLLSLILEAILRNPETQEMVLRQVNSYLGPSAVQLVSSFISYFQKVHHSTALTIISVLILMITASGFFSNMRRSLNSIFGVKKKLSFRKSIVKKIRSTLLLIGVAIVMILSLFFNTFIVKIDSMLPKEVELSRMLISPLYFLLSLLVIMLIFMAVYHILPDRKVKWRYTISGAAVASLLFIFGKTLFEWYLGSINFESIYGAAGSIMMIMLWTYYSAIIFYFGAIFSRSHEEMAKRLKK